MNGGEFKLGVAGLGISAVALGIVQTGSLPQWVGWLIVACGAGFILYAVSPFSVAGLRRQIALYMPVAPKKTVTIERGLTFAARLHWRDDVGKPLVAAPDGRIRHIWARLDIEFRNHNQYQERIIGLYLEIRHNSIRRLRRTIATADPVKVDDQADWNETRFPRRVEWSLKPVGEAVGHFVQFERGWDVDDQTAPRDPKTFMAVLVAELGTGGRPIRLQLGEDIWHTGETPQQIERDDD